MSGQRAWPGLQVNYFLHSSSSHDRMGDQFSKSSVKQLRLLTTDEIFCGFSAFTCSTTLLGGGIFQTVKSCMIIITVILSAHSCSFVLVGQKNNIIIIARLKKILK